VGGILVALSIWLAYLRDNMMTPSPLQSGMGISIGTRDRSLIPNRGPCDFR